MNKNGRVYALDGLRGLAAYTVAFSHYTLQTKFMKDTFGLSGQVAVMVFFVLSGFLMGKIYIGREFSGENVLRYLRHRLGRVLPLYFLIVFLCYGFSQAGHWWPFFPMNTSVFLEHVFFIKGVSVLWSIPAEVQFYVLFPALWYAYAKWSNTALLWAGLAICAVAFLGFPQTPIVAFYLPYFLVGVICARIDPKIGAGMNAVFVVAMVGYVYCWPEISGLRGIWTMPQYLILMAVIVLSVANAPWADTALGNRVGQFTGKISYSVYLWHMPVLISLLWFRPVPVDTFSFIVLYLASVTGAASLSFYLFENPARRLIYGERPIWKLPLLGGIVTANHGSADAGNSVRNSATVG